MLEHDGIYVAQFFGSGFVPGELFFAYVIYMFINCWYIVRRTSQSDEYLT